jgi:hypothetical protein
MNLDCFEGMGEKQRLGKIIDEIGLAQFQTEPGPPME